MQELEPLVLAALVELDSDEFALGWLLDIVRDACPDAEFDALKRLVLGIVGELLSRDLAQVHRYVDLDLGLADLSVIVLAHRHRTRRLLTFDERDFRVVSPIQGGAFTLLPADL